MTKVCDKQEFEEVEAILAVDLGKQNILKFGTGNIFRECVYVFVRISIKQDLFLEKKTKNKVRIIIDNGLDLC